MGTADLGQGERVSDPPPEVLAIDPHDEQVAGRLDAGGLALANVVHECQVSALTIELDLIYPPHAALLGQRTPFPLRDVLQPRDWVRLPREPSCSRAIAGGGLGSGCGNAVPGGSVWNPGAGHLRYGIPVVNPRPLVAHRRPVSRVCNNFISSLG